MKLSKKITATAAATALASAALLTPVANAQEGEGTAPAAGDENTQPEDNGAGEEAPAKEDIEAPAAEAPAEGEAEAPAAEAPAADAEAPAERNVQLANTGVKPEISILAGLALISMVAGAWMMFARRQA